jgi:hypothetical protein
MSVSPALLINIKIEEEEKFNLFKITLSDLRGLFSECHIKFRGAYSYKCLEFAKEILGTSESLSVYQDLQEDDWVDATLNMLGNVKSRSLFLYFEDHKLVSTRMHLDSVLADFDKQNLDYLCYSWFQASALGIENLLPLNPERGSLLHAIDYSKTQNALIGKISPRYYPFSLVSVCSVDYLRSIMTSCNMRFKFYSKTVSALLSRLFPYPRYRKVAHIVNNFVSKCSACLCLYPPASPFNLERIWFETIFINRPLRFGFLTKELFANFDDDNGADGESLMKRGLYPFTEDADIRPEDIPGTKVKQHLKLSQGQYLDLKYHSAIGRIRRPPIVFIKVKSGRVLLKCSESEVYLRPGDLKSIYSNKGGVLVADEAVVLEIQICDEAF